MARIFSFFLFPCVSSSQSTDASLPCPFLMGRPLSRRRSPWKQLMGGLASQSASPWLPIVYTEKGPQDSWSPIQRAVQVRAASPPASQRSLHLINCRSLPWCDSPGREGVSQGNQNGGQRGEGGGEKGGFRRAVRQGLTRLPTDQGLECWDAARLENFNLLSLRAPFEGSGGIYTQSINHMKQGGDL